MINVWGVGYRLMDSERVGERVPAQVTDLYEQLAFHRPAGRERRSPRGHVERPFAPSPPALEEASGVLLHAAVTFIAARRAASRTVRR